MVAAAIVGSAAIGAVGSSMAADSAADAQNHAVDAQSGIAAQQQQLAQEQWDYQKNIYLPKAMQQSDDQLALSKQIAQKQMDASDFYQGIAGQSFDQAKKSYEFQDDYMQLARDYLSGKTGNTMANEANANVEQAYAGTGAQMTRAAGRMGINPGSGAFISTLGDLYNQKALASAGGQTAAQKAARDKAEQMVGIAAGSGAAGFGTGLSAGGLATGSTAGASATNNASLNGLNSVANTVSNGAATAGGLYSGSANTWNSVVKNSGSSPWGDFASGLGNAGLKMAGSNVFSNNSTTNWMGQPIDSGNSTWGSLSGSNGDQPYG